MVMRARLVNRQCRRVNRTLGILDHEPGRRAKSNVHLSSGRRSTNHISSHQYQGVGGRRYFIKVGAPIDLICRANIGILIFDSGELGSRRRKRRKIIGKVFKPFAGKGKRCSALFWSNNFSTGVPAKTCATSQSAALPSFLTVSLELWGRNPISFDPLQAKRRGNLLPSNNMLCRRFQAVAVNVKALPSVFNIAGSLAMSLICPTVTPKPFVDPLNDRARIIGVDRFGGEQVLKSVA